MIFILLLSLLWTQYMMLIKPLTAYCNSLNTLPTTSFIKYTLDILIVCIYKHFFQSPWNHHNKGLLQSSSFTDLQLNNLTKIENLSWFAYKERRLLELRKIWRFHTSYFNNKSQNNESQTRVKTKYKYDNHLDLSLSKFNMNRFTPILLISMLSWTILTGLSDTSICKTWQWACDLSLWSLELKIIKFFLLNYNLAAMFKDSLIIPFDIWPYCSYHWCTFNSQALHK